MNVYQCIAAVMGDLAKSGISKDETNTFDKYKFRGIDAVYNALAPLLSKHGLVVLPRVLERHSEERASQKGGALFYVTVKVEFDFVSAEDSSTHTICAYGEAMDRGDKGTNKAMTAAYKYACFEAFCIPTEGSDDADSESHAVKAIPAGRPLDGAWDAMDDDEKAFLRKIANEVTAIVASGDSASGHDYIHGQQLTTEEKMALWTQLDSKTRAALKKADAAAKAAKEQA